MEDLDPLVGLWRLAASLAVAGEAPRAEASFEWLEGRRFLIERWRIDIPEAPDGIAVIGRGKTEGTYRQHYFDSRGVERVYEMTLAEGVWRLWRTASAPDFSQRFTGTFSTDGNTISGAWEISHDGSTWEHDFDLTYTRVVAR
jgi:hypothetical protein